MAPGSTTKQRKKKKGGGKAQPQQPQPQQQQQQQQQQQEEQQEQGEDTVVLDADGQEVLALAQALGDGLQQQPANDDDGSVTAALARRLAVYGIALTFDPAKGRVCVAAEGFEPGRVLLEERAYVHGAGPAATGLFCLECDDDTHSAKGCPVARRMYPKAVLAQLPQLEAWMAQRLGRVQTLDRARAWLKAIARMHDSLPSDDDRNDSQTPLLYPSSSSPSSPSERAGKADNSTDDHKAPPPSSPSSPSQWALPLLPLTACNLPACVRDAQALARRHPALFPYGPQSLALAARLLGALNTNSHELEELGPGSGLFLLASLMEHACMPNCAFSTFNSMLRLTTLRPMPKGTPLSIDYSGLCYAPASERRSVLQSTYGFTCRCPACLGYVEGEEEKERPLQLSAPAPSSSPSVSALGGQGQENKEASPPPPSASFSSSSSSTSAASSSSSSSSSPSIAAATRPKWTHPDRARAFTCPVDDCDGPVCPYGEGGAFWACLSCGRAALPAERQAYCAAEAAVLNHNPLGAQAADAVLRATPLHRTHYAVYGAVEAAARLLAREQDRAAAPLALQAWERTLAVLNEGLSTLYPPPGLAAAAAVIASSSSSSSSSSRMGVVVVSGGQQKGSAPSSSLASAAVRKQGGAGGGGFACAHHPEIPALLDRVAQARVIAGDVEGAQAAWRDAYQSASLITGPDWVPTVDLARLATKPPKNRKEVQSYYARRSALLHQLEAEIKGTTAASSSSAAAGAAAAAASSSSSSSSGGEQMTTPPPPPPVPFPGPYPAGYRSVVIQGGEEQEKRWAALCGRLSGEKTQRALAEGGVAVLDSALGPEWSNALRAEIEHLVRLGVGCMKPNQTRFGPTEVYTKPYITEADLHDPSLRTRVPALAALLEREDLTRALTTPDMPLAGMAGRALKVQRNGGGGACFPLHFDNPSRPNKRRFTCLIYLNPGWQEGDGGELLLLPFLAEKPTVIPPLMDRMVVFRSDAMLHRVLPAHRERYCLTVWLDGAEGTVNTDVDVQLRLSRQEAHDPLTLASKLRLHPSQRAVSRPVYAEEYEASLRECMVEGTPGAAQMLSAHAAHLEAVRKNPPLARLVDMLRVLKEERAGRADTGQV